MSGHRPSGSISTTQNQKAQLANAYSELGKELASSKVRVVGNYTLGKVIGEGAYGKVRIGTHRLTATRVAIKQIPKAMSASLTREIHHHRQLHHPHIAQMYEVIATENSIWIVTELCSGGELFDYLVEKGRLSETEAKFIFGQLCLAVAYLHNKGIIHRDLKLENVLLDERCRVKLGDFGFTREFDKNTFMETFCGTTGYASPEMLQCKKYTGPEVDIWSLGVILYCLLTGMLPFDDDDESVMRDKIIQGEFEDPTWLSTESRDLIKNLLQKDPAQRLTLPQILAHSWFTTDDLHYEMVDDPSLDRPLSPEVHGNPASSETSHSTSATSTSTTDSNYTSAPTTPDDSTDDPFTVGLNDNRTKDPAFIHRNLSETTIRTKLSSYQSENLEGGPSSKIGTVPEEDGDEVFLEGTSTSAGQVSANSSNEPTPNPRRLSGSSMRSYAPPMHTVRTPARTKRRSVSSTLSLTLSNPSSPTMEKTPTMERTPTLPDPSTTQGSDTDFVGLLSTPAPIIFSTPLERQLLNSLSLMGFDLGQICYSVMNDACDATGALWWMLMKKAESKDRERQEPGASEPDLLSAISPTNDVPLSKSQPKTKKSRGIQTDIHSTHHRNKPLPQLGVVPPTPTTITGARPATPPASSQRSISPTPKHTPSSSTNLLEPNPRSSSLLESPLRSNPSTPGSKGRKARSGSVSIMQRATTALEAAGLVRKKSTEGVKEQREREAQAHYEREREWSKEMERRSGISILSNEESRTSTSSKLTKSPPLKPTKAGPSTPPPSEYHQSQPANVGSPWVLTESRDSLLGKAAPTPTNSPGEPLPPSISSLNLGEESASTGKSRTASRNRANLLTAFRLWFNEDRKGKRKENASSSSQGGSRFSNYSPASPPRQGYSTANVKRRTSGGNSNTKRRSHRAAHRASISSKRSSSVNSRRSSVASIQMVIMDSPTALQQQPRRSMGSYTPNSDKAEYMDYGSRPSSRNHKKSPSASSTGSMSMQQRTASPSLKNYHRRGSSGGSTRVVRQQSAGAARPIHVRSNSAASSIPSPSSSRPTSYIEYSENEGQRTASPHVRSRKHSDATPTRKGGGSTFIQKRQGPFSSPIHSYGNSLGRSSWKKSWGLEPPGWRTRTTHLPVEVLAISPANEPTSLRDVFSGRQSMGDESDWIDDEDDDIPYAPGLGQLPLNAAASGSTSSTTFVETTVTLSPAPRGHRTSKRSGSAVNTSTSTRQKAPTAGRVSPVQEKSTYEPGAETRTSRRQLPASARSGPGLAAMQEEDEEEEE